MRLSVFETRSERALRLMTCSTACRARYTQHRALRFLAQLRSQESESPKIVSEDEDVVLSPQEVVRSIEGLRGGVPEEGNSHCAQWRH